MEGTRPVMDMLTPITPKHTTINLPTATCVSQQLFYALILYLCLLSRLLYAYGC